MIDMARTPKELDTSEKDCCISDEEKYPWGLRINLDSDELEKLGITDLPKVGEDIKLEAVVRVQSVSELEEVGNDVDRSVGLQITKMGLISESKDASDDLYGSES